MKKIKNQKGFTLTELVVVIVIIGILAGTLIPTFRHYLINARSSANYQEALDVRRVMMMAYEAHYVYEYENEAGEVVSKQMTSFDSFVDLDLNEFYYDYTGIELDADVNFEDDMLTYYKRNIEVALNVYTLEYHLQ